MHAFVVNDSHEDESDEQVEDTKDAMDDVRILQAVPGLRAIPGCIALPIKRAKSFRGSLASFDTQ